MDETFEVKTEPQKMAQGDKIAVTVLSALACLVTSSLVEKSYFGVKSQIQARRTTAPEQ